MNKQQAVVDQVVQNLAFEVEAVPKYEPIQTKSVSQITPLNVKIKVRRKDDINMQHDVSSIADNTARTAQKVRLVNSDQTIMTFDVFMEAEFEKKPSRKLRKHIFDLLKPGICLGAVDDDERPYIPSTSYSANITEPSVVTKSNGTLKQTFTLSKNVFEAYSVSTQPGVQKWLFGNCKPGGCLDPPFSEEKYSYKPSTRLGPEREENIEAEENKSDVYSNKKPVMLHDEETQSNGRHSSIFDNGLFKKKRKSSDKSTNTNLPEKATSIVDVYPRVSATNSMSTHSNPIITYPPKTKGNPRISDDKTVRSRGPSEEKPRHSFNDHSEPYYVPPKGVQRIKEKVALDPNDQPKHQSSDATVLLKESFKVPVPLPIPVPISIDSSKRKPEIIATSDDIIKKDSIPDQDIQDQKLLDQELQGTINLKDIKIPLRLSRTNSEGGDTDNKPVDNLPIAILVPSNIKKTTVPKEIDDQNSDEAKLQSLKAKYNKNNIEDSAQQNLKKKTSSSKIPVLLPINFSDPNHTDTNSTDSMKNVDIDDGMKLSHSKKSFEIEAMPSIIKDTPFQGSKDMEQNIEPRLGENESFSNAIPNWKHSNTEIDAIPENFLRTRDSFSDQESDTEIPIDLDMKRDSNAEINAIPENILRTGGIVSDQESDTEMLINLDMKEDSKGKQYTDEVKEIAKQNDNASKATLNTKEPMRESSIGAEITDGIIKAVEKNDTKQNENMKRDSEEKKNTDGIEKLTKTDTENKALTPTLYSKDNIKQDSEGKKVIEGIKKPSNQKDIKDIAAIPMKYTEDDIKPYSEGDKITDGIERPEKQSESVVEALLTKYADKDTKRDSEEETITDKIENLTKQKTSQDEPASATIHSEDSLDVFGMPDTHQNIDSPKKDERKEERTNIITASVSIDNTKETPILGTIKEVSNEKKIVNESIVPSFKKFDEHVYSTVTHEFGTKAVIYNTDGFMPSTSAEKLPGGISLSSVQSANILKSAMKKDTIFIDFGFHSYLNDKNERIVQTVDSENAPKLLSSDSVTVIKSQVRISSNEIRIPVDSEHDISIQLKKANANQRVSISESRLVNDIETKRANKQRSPVQYVETRSSEVKAEGRKDKVQESAITDRFLDYYEQELVPLQLMIKNLREEIDFLATQQSIFKDKLYCINKSKLPRLVHSNKKCFGCVRK